MSGPLSQTAKGEMAETCKGQNPPELPPTPEIGRRIRFAPLQAIGVPVLMLIPVLGLLGLFDTSAARVQSESGGYSLDVVYPSRFRHRPLEALRITVRNGTGAEIQKLAVKVSRQYADAFENVTFAPEPKEIDAKHVVFEFESVAAGESRIVEMQMQSLRTGSQNAEVIAGPASVRFSTFVLP